MKTVSQRSSSTSIHSGGGTVREGDEFLVNGRRLLVLFRRRTTGEKRPSSDESSARSSLSLCVIPTRNSTSSWPSRLFSSSFTLPALRSSLPLTADDCKERAAQLDGSRCRRSDAIVQAAALRCKPGVCQAVPPMAAARTMKVKVAGYFQLWRNEPHTIRNFNPPIAHDVSPMMILRILGDPIHVHWLR